MQKWNREITMTLFGNSILLVIWKGAMDMEKS